VKVLRSSQLGFRSEEFPIIVFPDQVHGQSKMSKKILLEGLWFVARSQLSCEAPTWEGPDRRVAGVRPVSRVIHLRVDGFEGTRTLPMQPPCLQCRIADAGHPLGSRLSICFQLWFQGGC